MRWDRGITDLLLAVALVAAFVIFTLLPSPEVLP